MSTVDILATEVGSLQGEVADLEKRLLLEEKKETRWRETVVDLRQALQVAAKALRIADDWGVETLELAVPKEWNLPPCDEEGKSWFYTHYLADFLEKL